MSKKYYPKKRYYRRRSASGRTSEKLFALVAMIVVLCYAYISNHSTIGDSSFGYTRETWISIAILAFIALAIVFFAVLRIAGSIKQKRRYLNSTITTIDAMSGVEFELYLKAHFNKLGYQVSLTSASNDYGADLILKKDGTTTVVQAKRYKEKVGIAAIQQVIAAKGYYGASHCIVATNSFYTTNAKRLAQTNDVELWDRNSLIDIFQVV